MIFYSGFIPGFSKTFQSKTYFIKRQRKKKIIAASHVFGATIPTIFADVNKSLPP
jgi:hypothetical protein